MLTKPELDDEILIACLSRIYGLRVTQLAFLPLGADVNTAVYKALADSGQGYFLKLRRGPFDPMTVALPDFLARQGLRVVIAPIPTSAGQLWSRLEPFTLTLYSFVEGLDGYHIALSKRQWVELGAALHRLHTLSLPAALRLELPRETYSPIHRERVRVFQNRLEADVFADPLAAELAALLRARATVIRQLVEGAERLGRQLQAKTPEWALCHGDLHNGNVLISPDGSLYIVDWDTALLAPKERDLMFVGSGLGRAAHAAREADWFYHGSDPGSGGYGPASIDPVALAYYRCERIVEDIAEFCEQILSAAGADQDRTQALYYLRRQFEPGAVVNVALLSLAAAP